MDLQELFDFITVTKYFSPSFIISSTSTIRGPFPKFNKLALGSCFIADNLVPNLLLASCPVRQCIAGICSHIDDPRIFTSP